MNKFFENEQELQEFKQWITALRSGEYKQTKNTLQDENGYCCLGVACKVVIPEDNQLLKEDKYFSGSFPFHQSYAPRWLKQINDDFYKKTEKALTVLNDNKHLTFDEIADCLEAVYLLNVMEN